MRMTTARFCLARTARIENLLGAGGAIANTYVKDGLGAGLLTAMTTGNYAGECARTAILGE